MRVLLISHEYPPCGRIGAFRWEAMTRYLREWGHTVTVVTSDLYGELDPARVIEETGLGISVDPNDPALIAEALERVVKARGIPEFAPRGLERFRYPGPARQMEAALLEAIELRRSRVRNRRR